MPLAESFGPGLLLAGVRVVHGGRDVDIVTAPRLRARLAALAAAGRPVMVDLDQGRFIDAAGLGALAGAAVARERLTGALDELDDTVLQIRDYVLTSGDAE